jgi:HEAT repeat protein
VSSAAPDIEGFKAARNVPALIEALSEDDGHVRAAAARALREIGDDRAVEPLISSLHDAYEATTEKGLLEGWPSNPVVHVAAAEALGSIGSKRAIEGLIAYGLHSEGIRSALLAIGGPPVAERLIPLLASPSALEVEAAAGLLAQLGDRRAVEPLLAAFDRSAGEYRPMIVIARALGALGDERAVPALVRDLERSEHRWPGYEADLEMRALVSALESIGGPEAERALAAHRDTFGATEAREAVEFMVHAAEG